MTRGTRKHLKAVKRRRALKERYPRIAGTRRRFEGPVVSALTQGGRPSLLRPPLWQRLWGHLPFWRTRRR